MTADEKTAEITEQSAEMIENTRLKYEKKTQKLEDLTSKLQKAYSLYNYAKNGGAEQHLKSKAELEIKKLERKIEDYTKKLEDWINDQMTSINDWLDDQKKQLTSWLLISNKSEADILTARIETLKKDMEAKIRIAEASSQIAESTSRIASNTKNISSNISYDFSNVESLTDKYDDNDGRDMPNDPNDINLYSNYNDIKSREERWNTYYKQEEERITALKSQQEVRERSSSWSNGQRPRGKLPDNRIPPLNSASYNINQLNNLLADAKAQCKRDIKEIFIHCTADPEGKENNVDQINRMHINKNGWKCIGYHYLIYLDGSIHIGRPVSQSGAHADMHNSKSIGVCYVGGMDKEYKKAKDTRTDKQYNSLRALVEGLKKIWPNAAVVGHNEFSSKACPSFNVQNEPWVQRLKK